MFFCVEKKDRKHKLLFMWKLFTISHTVSSYLTQSKLVYDW